MELKLIGQMLRRWSWLLVIGILVGGGIGYAISIYQTPEYLARTKILVMEPLGDNASNVNNLNDKELAETYMQLLTTQPILESVSQKVGVKVRDTQIKATRVRDTGLLEVSVRDTDAQRAALTANVLVEVLIEYNEALQKSRFSSSEQSLELQVSEIKSELGRLESNVEQKSEQTLEEQRQTVEQKKTELEQQIFTLQGEIARLQQDIDDLTPEALPNQLPPPLTLEQRNQLNEKRTQLAQKEFQLDLAK
ncbi:MAG TPA: Wzz/FepE/Etk N-terminal domain-containing protein, partial [Promineifilum sp.]|nr:Wzz/FepE/Etk N-terminal domain-containing protein [Promineifilum sp.]